MICVFDFSMDVCKYFISWITLKGKTMERTTRKAFIFQIKMLKLLKKEFNAVLIQ